MFPIRHLLLLSISASVGTAILEFVGQADLDAVRIRLEEEKAKRLLLQNDVEVLMLQVEEINRKLSYISKDSMAVSGNLTSLTPSIAFTATLSQDTSHVSGQTVIFDNVKVNEGDSYDSSTGKFRAPFRGLYIFSVTVLCINTNARLMIMKDDVEIGRAYSGPNSAVDSGTVMVVTVMEKGQFTYVKEFPGFIETMYGDNLATFTGLLHARYS